MVEESQELALKDDSPLLDRIISHIDQFFIRHQKKLERLTSIAITLPGIIDTENGIVHRMPFYEDVKEMPLGEALARRGARFWSSIPAFRFIFSMISAHGRWQRPCLVPHAGRAM